MSIGWSLQILINLLMLVGLVVVWQRLRRPDSEDPRLSRGLQLLQSKLAVLEDLSDRTDAQVRQLSNLLDQKARQLQNKIVEAEHQIQRVDQAMKKSKEVAEIFQDRIPHQEIIERQNTVKYVKAAQMAHNGSTVEEIAASVDLPVSQVEMIAKVNQGQLRFDEDSLPEWAKVEPLKEPVSFLGVSSKSGMTSSAAETTAAAPTMTEVGDGLATGAASHQDPSMAFESLKKLGEEFRQAVRDHQPKATAPPSRVIRKEISRVQFPRVDIKQNLT